MLMIRACLVTANGRDEVLEDGALLIEGGIIRDIGATSELIRRYPEEGRFDCKGNIVMPGFVNVHYHGALTIARGVGPDLGLPPLYSPHIPQGVLLSEEECYLFSLFGYAEALKAGSTCIGANYIYMNRHVKAIADLGLRAVASERVHDIDFFEIGRGKYVHDARTGAETLQRNVDLIETWQGKSGKIRCHMGVHAPDTCTRPFLEQSVRLARHYGVGFTTHLAQSMKEVEEIRRREGMSPVRYYEEMGMLGRETVAAHCIHVSEEDMERLQRSGTHVAQVPEGNLKKGDLAPVGRMRKMGVHLALCTDSMSGSMLEAMRFCMVAHRLSGESKTEPQPAELIRMATIHGARALGWEDEIGSIEVGKKADLIMIDTERFHLLPIVSPAGTLVHCAVGTDVSHVWIEGELKVCEGKIVGFDEQRLLREVRRAAEACWQRFKAGKA